jgi:putative ABC transport system permease protein
MSEMRTAWRQLRQAPAFAIASIVTLALGIGANTVLFSVADAVVFHPLGFANEDRLVIAGEDSVEPRSEIARERLLKWRVRTRAFDQIEAMVSSNFAFKIAGPDPIPIEYRAVSAGFFDLLGVPPALGRGFVATDDHRNAARVLVLSHGLWQRQFGGDPAVIGRTIVLEDVGLNAGRSTSFTIVGVMPAYFRYPLGAQIWTPLVPMLASITGPGLPDFVDSPDGNILFAIARLKPRIAIAQAHADLDRVTADLRAEAGQQQRVASRVTPLLDDLLGSTRLNLWALLGAAGLLFLVASANVAGLLLTRTSIRRREFAIRAALGATRGAISRQILAESFLLAVGATIVAVLAAWLTLPAALALVPDTTPRIDGVAMNVRVIVFTLIAGALTTLLCWAAPALNADGARIDVLLRSAGRAFTSGGFSRRARRALGSVEIAIAVVVLTCSGLLLRSVSRLDRIDLGFDPHNLAAAYVDRPARYDGNAENVRRFADDVIATIGRQPAVSAVAGVGPRQLGSRFELEGQPAQDVQRNPLTTVSLVTPTYFSTRPSSGEASRRATTRMRRSSRSSIRPSRDWLGRDNRRSASGSSSGTTTATAGERWSAWFLMCATRISRSCRRRCTCRTARLTFPSGDS